jgi:hypothetical protein
VKYYGIYGTPHQQQVANQTSVRLNKIGSITDPNGKRLYQLYKSGGILKAQNGYSLADIIKANEQYATKTPVNQPTPDNVITGVKDMSRALKNSSTLDRISLAGSIASLVPALGVIGGLVSTGADVASGIKNG